MRAPNCLQALGIAVALAFLPLSAAANPILMCACVVPGADLSDVESFCNTAAIEEGYSSGGRLREARQGDFPAKGFRTFGEKDCTDFVSATPTCISAFGATSLAREAIVCAPKGQQTITP